MNTATERLQTNDTDRPASSAKVAEEPPVYYVRNKEGRLVPLLGFSYEDFQEFLKHKNSTTEAAAGSNSASIEQSIITGEVHENTAELNAQYKIRLHTSDWVTVPLMGGGPVLRGEPEFQGGVEHAVQYNGANSNYTAQLKGAIGSEQQISLKFIVPLKSAGAQIQFKMAVPASAASQLTLRVPEPRIELTDHAGAALADVKATRNGDSEINCLGLDGPLTIGWRSTGSNTNLALHTLDAAGQILAQIDGRRVHFDCRLTVNSLDGSFDRFQVKLPPQAELTPIALQPTGYSLTATGAPGSQIVEVQLAQRTIGPIEVQIQADRPYDITKPNQSLELAGFSVVEAFPHRQSGQIAVAVEGDWQVSWNQQSRVRQIEDLVEPLQNKSVIAGFEYFGQPASLLARVSPRKTRIIVEPEYQYFIDTHQAHLQATLKYAIRGAKISALEIAMPEWEIDELKPAGMVDVDAIPAAGDAASTIQLMQPTTGEFELIVKAHRELPNGAGRIDLPLPVPTADVVGPAILAVLPADNVRLRAREADFQGLNRILLPPRMRLPLVQQPAQFFRAEQLPASFVADLERIPQSVSAAVETTMELRRDAVQVEEHFKYRVEHESLSSISLDVPSALLSESDLQFEFDGQTLPPVAPAAMDSDAAFATVDIPLPAPQLGTFEIIAKYRLAQRPPFGQSGSYLTAPLLMPSTASLTTNNLTVTGEMAGRVQPHDELWSIVDDAPISPGARPTLRLSAGQATADVSLAFTESENRGQSATTIERQWVQTWIMGGVRQDRAVYRVRSAAEELDIDLPIGVSLTQIDARFDRRPLAPLVGRNGTVSLKVPLAGQNQVHVLEVRYQLAGSAANLHESEMSFPRFNGSVWIQRAYWQLILPSDQHLVSLPEGLTPEFKWIWSVPFWSRQPSLEQSDLEHWVGAEPDSAAPASTNQYLFSAVGNISTVSVKAAPRWQIVLVGSTVALGLGLLLIYIRALRQSGVLLTAAVCFLAVALWLPDVAVLFSQAAVAGIVLAVMAAFLRRLMVRRQKHNAIVSRRSSSSIERTKSPSKVRSLELIGAASTLSAPAHLELPPGERAEE